MIVVFDLFGRVVGGVGVCCVDFFCGVVGFCVGVCVGVGCFVEVMVGGGIDVCVVVFDLFCGVVHVVASCCAEFSCGAGCARVGVGAVV